MYGNNTFGYGLTTNYSIPYIKFAPREEVIVATDTFSFDIPLGERGIVVNPNAPAAHGLKACIVRLTDIQQTWTIPEQDLMRFSDYVHTSIVQAIRGYRINQALDNHDEDAFQRALQIGESGDF